MKPTLVQMVRVPIKGRVEIMSLADVSTLIGDLSTVLRAHSSDSRHSSDSGRIKFAVCAEFGIRMDQMDSDKRPERIVFPRQVAYWLHRTLTDMSLSEIGSRFPRRNGKARDHGTVLHGWHVVENRMHTDRKMRERIAALQTKLSLEEVEP